MEANLDDLLHEYDSYVAFQPQTDVVRAKGRSWASNLLKELRKTKVGFKIRKYANSIIVLPICMLDSQT